MKLWQAPPRMASRVLQWSWRKEKGKESKESRVNFTMSGGTSEGSMIEWVDYLGM